MLPFDRSARALRRLVAASRDPGPRPRIFVPLGIALVLAVPARRHARVRGPRRARQGRALSRCTYAATARTSRSVSRTPPCGSIGTAAESGPGTPRVTAEAIDARLPST